MRSWKTGRAATAEAGREGRRWGGGKEKQRYTCFTLMFVPSFIAHIQQIPFYGDQLWRERRMKEVQRTTLKLWQQVWKTLCNIQRAPNLLEDPLHARVVFLVLPFVLVFSERLVSSSVRVKKRIVLGGCFGVRHQHHHSSPRRYWLDRWRLNIEHPLACSCAADMQSGHTHKASTPRGTFNHSFHVIFQAGIPINDLNE